MITSFSASSSSATWSASAGSSCTRRTRRAGPAGTPGNDPSDRSFSRAPKSVLSLFRKDLSSSLVNHLSGLPHKKKTEEILNLYLEHSAARQHRSERLPAISPSHHFRNLQYPQIIPSRPSPKDSHDWRSRCHRWIHDCSRYRKHRRRHVRLERCHL